MAKKTHEMLDLSWQQGELQAGGMIVLTVRMTRAELTCPCTHKTLFPVIREL